MFASAGFEEADGPSHIDVLIDKRFSDGRSDPCLGRKVDHKADLVLFENLTQVFFVANVSGHKFKVPRKLLSNLLHMSHLDVGVVEGIEVVEADHRVPLLQ